MADRLNKEENSDEKRLKRLKGDFVADFSAEKEWRRDKIEYGKFYDGEQLSEEETRALKERGQPPVVINRIKPKLDAIFGIQSALQVDTKVYASGNREEEALEVSEELRRVEDDSEFDAQECLAFEDMCIDGRAWYKIFKEFNGLEGVDRVKHVANDNVVIDRHCAVEDLRTGELRTAHHVHETVWLNLEDAQGMFPGYKQELEDAVSNPEIAAPLMAEKLKEVNPDQYRETGSGSASADPDLNEYLNFIDKKRKRLRVVTTYYRAPVITKWLRHSNGTVDVTDYKPAQVDKLIEELQGAQTWTETKYTLNTATFTWNTILEEKKDIRSYDRDAKFPLILVPAYVTRDEKKKHYGIVKQQLDPQREVNKRRSKMLHLLNTNQVWYEKGAFEDESKAFSEMARPDGKIAYRKEFKVDNIRHQDLAQSQFQLLQESKNEIDTAGVNREIEGRSNAGSGREFQLRQQQAMQSLRKLFVNLRSARKRVAAFVLDEILNRKPELEIRSYDLVIEEAPDTINLQSETFDSLVSLARGGMPIPPDMIIEASPLAAPKKKEFMQRMQQQQQAQAQMLQAQAQQQQPAPAQ